MGREINNGLKFKTQYGSNGDLGPTKEKSGYDLLLGTQLQTGQSNLNPNQNSAMRTSREGTRRDNHGDRNRGVKHLPYSELMDRKARGLCFCCGEHYTPLHQCAEKQWRLVIMGDDEVVNDNGEVMAIELQGELEATVDCKMMAVCNPEQGGRIQIPFSALLQLVGMVKGMLVTIMLDIRACHNFTLLK